MSPFLEVGTIFEDGEEAKFVRIGDNIYYSDSKNPMIWSMEKHARLAEKLGAKIGSDDKPLVDDAGKIVNINGKFSFYEMSSTCEPITSYKSARSETFLVAKKILGEDKVV
jgi:hypothetical protein